MSRFGLGIPHGDNPYANDAYTTWLVHFDTSNNSTAESDHSAKQNGAVIVGGSGYQPPGTGLFGPSSMWFAGDTYVYSPGHVENAFNLYFSDFTIDWWEYCTDNTVFRPTFTWDTIGVVYVPMLVGWGDSAIYYYASNDQASWNIVSAMPMGTRQVSTWVHRAIVRKGTTFYAFENGVLKGSATSALAFPNATYGPMLGCWPNPGGYAYMAGYIDEFRVSRGIARWTANFIPPSAPYGPVDAPKITDPVLLLTHFDGDLRDSSQYRRISPPPVAGTMVTSTAQSKFGGQSALFDGTCYMAFYPSADWVLGTSDWTADFWVFQSARQAADGIVAAYHQNHNTYADRWGIRINASGLLRFDCVIGGADKVAYVTTIPIPLNAWTHCAVVCRNSTIYFYINGVADNSTPITGGTIPFSGGYFLIGGYYDGGNKFVGFIDEFRFTKKALWTASFTPPTQPGC